MFAAVARLLSNVARRGAPGDHDGILLVLDDLQWAGGDALELLTDLVHPGVPIPGEHRPVRVVGAYRDTEVQPQDVLGVAMADWAQAGLVTHRALGPFAAEECGRLLDELLAGAEPDGPSTDGRAALRERVLQRAGGVPFFVVSYAHALRQGDVRGGAEGVPWDVAQGVRQRVAGLPEPARTLLEAAAVFGRSSQAALLMAVAAQPEEDVLAGLEAACRARPLLDAGRVYQFAHDVVREVVEADIGSARRTILHRRAAKAIEDLNGEQLADQYETLADHYSHGEAWDKALQYLALSGDKAVSSGAIRQALSYYERALGVCARLGTPAQEIAGAIAEKRAFVCYDSGDFDGAIADFARMRAAAARLGDRRREGMSLACGGRATYYGHEFEVAEETLRAALALLDRWQSAVTSSNQLLVLLWTKWEAAVACGGKGDYARALPLLDEVITSCVNSGETFIRARAFNTAGWIHSELQDHQRAIELNEQSLALAELIETADTEIGNARLNLGDSYLALGRLAEAEGQFQAVERIVRNPRAQDRWMLWRYAQHLFHSCAELRLARGDSVSALAYADECLRKAEASDSPKNIVKACRLRGEVFMVRGQLAEAEAELDRALTLARRIGNPPQVWKTLVAFGDLETVRGSLAAALDAFSEALGVVEDVAARLPDAALRDTFVTSPHVLRIRQRVGSNTGAIPE